MQTDHSSDLGQNEELRQAVALVLDVAGSTELAQQIGAERNFALMRELVGIASDAVQRQGGHPLSFTGDGIFALFGAPMAVERAALRACRAALGIVARVRADAAGMDRRFGQAPQVRIGLASGEVLVGSVAMGGKQTVSAGGPAIALAQRLQALAPVGEVACSRDLVAGVEGDATFRPLGTHALKGFVAPQEVFALTGLARQGLASPVGPFIGRSRPLAALRDWAIPGVQAATLCLVQGPPGIGKSRIVAELARDLAAQRRLVLGACFAESGTRPLAVLFDIVRAAMTPEGGGWPLDRLLSQSVPGATALGDYLLPGASAERDVTYDEAVRLRRDLAQAVQTLAEAPDCLLVIEDLHWIDQASAEVLADVLDRATPGGGRILATTRPTEGRPWPHAQVVALDPMDRAETTELAGSVLGQGGDTAAHLDLVVEKAEGNPFFVVELARHLLNSASAGASPASAGTVQNLAFARFDSLDTDTRHALRLAAVIGRSFPFAALAAAGLMPSGRVSTFLERAKGLVQPDLVNPDSHGAFSHVLWRDVILHSLPGARRSTLHGQAGEALETLHGPHASQHAAALLDHFERAGQIARALPYFLAAAEQAYRLFALPIADGLLTRALDLVEAHPEAADEALFGQLFQLFVRLLEDQGHYARLIEARDRWADRLAAPGLARIRVVATAIQAKAVCHSADFARSVTLIEELEQEAISLGLTYELAVVRVMMMRIVVDSGLRPAETVERLYAETADVAEQGQDVQLARLRAYHYVAYHRALGQLPRAMQENQALYDLAERHRDLACRVNADWSKALIFAWGSDHVRTEQACRDCLENVLPGTAHYRVAVSALISSRMHQGDVVEPEHFLRMADECRRNSEANSLIAQQFNAVIALLKAGRLREARHHFTMLGAQVETLANVEFRKLGRMALGELELAVAGAIAPTGPRPRLGLADALAGLRWRIGALGRARRRMTDCLQASLTGEDYFAARSLVGLALAEKHAGRDKAGVARLEAEARRLCALQDLPSLAARLDQPAPRG